jgi:hypothetical protein
MGTEIKDVAYNAFYKQPEMVRFLLTENLALKMLLMEKGLLDPEEFKQCKVAAERTLDKKAAEFVDDWKKANPDAVTLFDKARVAAQGKAIQPEVTVAASPSPSACQDRPPS